jgi:hypothetical protein
MGVRESRVDLPELAPIFGLSSRNAAGTRIAVAPRMVRAVPLPLPLRRDATLTVPALPSPIPPPARRGVMTTPLTAMQDLSSVIRALAAESTFDSAAQLVQREACRLTRSDALVVVVDWARGVIWTLQGRVSSEPTQQLVAQVASSGHRSVLGNSLLEPLGNAPARIVLALRRPPGMSFQASEVAMIAALAGGFAPILERLVTIS